MVSKALQEEQVGENVLMDDSGLGTISHKRLQSHSPEESVGNVPFADHRYINCHVSYASNEYFCTTGSVT